MSTILKALRRLEEDEHAQAPVSLDEALLESPAPERHGRRTGALWATVSAALVGVIAVAWSLSGLWLPASESLPESIPVASAETQEPVAPEVQVVQLEAANPPPAPAQASVEVFPNPDEIRREMQRLVGGAIQRAEEAAAAESAARPQGLEEVSDPKPVVAPVAKKPEEPVLAPAAVEVAKAPSAQAPAASLPKPVAEPMPVEVQPPPVAEFAVQEIIWHPNPARRVVVVEIDGAASRRLGEGDQNAGFKVIEIGLSEVEVLHGGAVLKRGITAN